MKKIVPIMHCFNNNYVIPAAVSFYSMLENASKDYEYKLYVLHSDISQENQIKLNDTVSNFSNSTLEFINMQHRFTELFHNTNIQAHFSKEIYYKFLAPSIFSQYDKIIITDVDVVFLGDISKEFEDFNLNDDYYIGAFKSFIKEGSFLEKYIKQYNDSFNETERKAIQYGAGYYIYNLKKMRDDKIEEKIIEFATLNSNRTKQPEQDSINIVCYPKIKTLLPQSVVCSYMYDLYKTKVDYSNDLNWKAEDVKKALENPIQLHYAGTEKPWTTPSTTKSEIWYSYLMKTPFWNEHMEKLALKQETQAEAFSKSYVIYLFKLIPIATIKNNIVFLFGKIKIAKLKENY